MNNNAKYMLHENNAPLAVFDSLASAKEAVASKCNEGSAYRIELLVAPARTRVWVYGHEMNDWIEQL